MAGGGTEDKCFLGKTFADQPIKSQKHFFTQPQISIKK
jgi:hypothetical protein